MENWNLKFDGSCNPNPGGIGAYGFILTRGKEIVKLGDGIIPKNPNMTNNIAEYYALSKGLTCFFSYLVNIKHESSLTIQGDSQLVVKQLNKQWKAHPSKPYYTSYNACSELLQKIRHKGVIVNIHWIPRENNQDCDDLSKAYKTK